MAAIQAAASASSAYQREAARFAAPAPPVGGKVINREATVSFGPFRVSYAATDYEFDLTGATAQTSFADALDAAATAARLVDTSGASNAGSGPANAISRRLALAGYQAAAAAPRAPTSGMFSATA